MSKTWDTIQEFRKNRFVNMALAVFVFLWGFWVLYGQSSVPGIALGIFFVIIGALALYDQVIGEPITETVADRF